MPPSHFWCSLTQETQPASTPLTFLSLLQATVVLEPLPTFGIVRIFSASSTFPLYPLLPYFTSTRGYLVARAPSMSFSKPTQNTIYEHTHTISRNGSLPLTGSPAPTIPTIRPGQSCSSHPGEHNNTSKVPMVAMVQNGYVLLLPLLVGGEPSLQVGTSGWDLRLGHQVETVSTHSQLALAASGGCLLQLESELLLVL